MLFLQKKYSLNLITQSFMKAFTLSIRLIALATFTLSLTSCVEMSETLNAVNSNLPTAYRGTGYIPVSEVLNVITVCYQASERQHALAEARAQEAMRSEKVRNSKTRYVAVPVPKKKHVAGGPKSDLMVVDKKTGEPVDNKVYETTDKQQLKTGQTQTVGGYNAMVYNDSPDA